jgi:leucyl aminopeptidase
MLPTSADVTVTVKPVLPKDVQLVAVFYAAGSDSAGEFAADLKTLVTAGLATGKAGEAVLTAIDGGKKKLIAIGLGDKSPAGIDVYRKAGGAIARAAKKSKVKSVGISAGLSADEAAAVVMGFTLASFEFREFKGTGQESEARPGVTLTVASVGTGLKEAVLRAKTICDGQNFARTIAFRPGNVINPPALAKVAKQLADEVGLKLRIIDEKEMAKLGMGGILAVGGGSKGTPPRMIVLEYPGTASAKKPATPLLVIGKSITFDTGGISIKGAQGMQGMVFDKCGGMAVLGLMYAAAKLKMPTRIVGILASAENHIGDTAYRPGDILKMYNGVTVEVTNTDAEGRLVLGDALAWGIETYKPTTVVDLATLTGSCVVALGKWTAGVLGNNDALIAELDTASKSVGEQIWRLPVTDQHREHLKSVPADIVNAPGRDAGTSTAAAFLSYFVPKDNSVAWAHLDIAGVAETEKELPYYGKGATGWGVQTLVKWITTRESAG